MQVSIFDFFHLMRLRMNYRNLNFVDNIASSDTKVYFEKYYASLLSLLVIYHDVWYKIGREPGMNERRSADWAIDDLVNYQGDKDMLFVLVRQGIEATITHTLDGVDRRFVEVVSFLLDLDLWGLGQPRVRFRDDTEKVWREFEPMYTREEFDKGTSACAASFLRRKWIYHTQKYRVYEGDAIRNLRELAGI